MVRRACRFSGRRKSLWTIRSWCSIGQWRWQTSSTLHALASMLPWHWPATYSWITYPPPSLSTGKSTSTSDVNGRILFPVIVSRTKNSREWCVQFDFTIVSSDGSLASITIHSGRRKLTVCTHWLLISSLIRSWSDSLYTSRLIPSLSSYSSPLDISSNEKD